MSTAPLVSVIVPAHDEEFGLRHTLESLLADAAPDEIDVVVVPNACTDRTAAIARSFPQVRVVETYVAGKVHAIGLGYDLCRTFPRLVLDADVRLSTHSVRSMAARLDVGDGVLAVAPRIEWDYSACGPLATRAHRAHDALMADRRVLSGVGAYLLGEQACLRVFPLPDVVADDEYVHRSFAPYERRTVPEAVSTTRPAPTFASLVRRRARARFGNRQLGPRTGSGPTAPVPPLSAADLVRGVRTCRIRPLDGAAFLAAVTAERILARYWQARGGASWSSDRAAHRTEEHV
ncbi:glycosyltransferase [Pseudonocardia tropica]|uniref:4,4'-diaponeurosporenoate glycosyltransferase n=1 Tax=Pseudonocardia tropica TaxID=681289 RepID=A0ABV1JXF3_9PSEU